MNDFFDDLSRRREEERERLRLQVYELIDKVLQTVHRLIMRRADYPMIDGESRRVSVYPLGEGPPTYLDVTDLGIDRVIFCDRLLYLGTDGTVYEYGLGNYAGNGAVLTYRPVDLESADAPLRHIHDWLQAIKT